MIWFANILLVLGYWLLGKQNLRWGFALGIVGNGIWSIVTLRMHRLDMASLGLIFTLLAVWGFGKTLCVNDSGKQ